MSTTWAKNFVGVNCNDFEMLQVPRPRTELTVHITIKTVQSGVILGSLVGASTALVKGESCCDARSRAANYGLKGAAIGLVAGPLLTFMTMRNQPEHAVYDRCYRLRFNSTSLFYDRVSVVGGAVGAMLGGGPGFVFGVDASVVGSMALRYMFGGKKHAIDVQKIQDGM